MKAVKYVKPDAIKIDKSFSVCWVIVRNERRFNQETQEDDDITQILRVCTDEDNAKNYINFLTKNKLYGKNVSFYSIPAPLGNIELPKYNN